jgi:competence protein ComEC
VRNPGGGPDLAGAARARTDLRMVPLAIAGWAAAWLGTWATPGAWALCGAGAAAAVLLARLRSSPWLAATALVAASLCVAGGVHVHQLRHGPVADLARAAAVVELQLEVRTDARVVPARGGRPGYSVSRVTVRQVSAGGDAWRTHVPGLVVVGRDAARDWASLAVGSRVTTWGRLQPPDQGSDVAAIVRIRGEPVLLSDPSQPLQLVERVRDGLRASVAGRAAEPRALVPALVVGDTSGLTPELEQEFAATGLTHLTAVSGANLTLLLAFLLTASRWIGVRGWGLRLIGLLGVVVFVALCRTEPSVLRAAAMGLVALAALGSGARRAGLRSLAVAILALLLLDPFLSRSVGFALSVLASGAIVWWARRWSMIMGRWLPGPVAESVTVPLAAHLATLPVVAAISGQVSLSGLVANTLAGPFVGPATVLGLVAAALSLVSGPAASACGLGAAWCAQVIIWVAHYGSTLPGSSWPLPATPATLAWLSVTALAGGLVVAGVLARPWLVLLLTTAMIVGLLGPPTSPGWPPRGWVLVACDVGQGDGLVIRTASKAAVVVDAGPDPAAMRRCLDQLKVAAVPLLVLTHFHADHVDGLDGVLSGRAVGQIWVSPLASPELEVREVRRMAEERGIPVTSPPVGARALVGEVALEVLGPVAVPAPLAEESSVENDSSLVVMATIWGLRILLTGDVEPDGQAAMLAHGVDLRADVLKIPHHGSARQDPAFFAATGARLAIASAGRDNDYGHPAPRTLQLARSYGMTVLRTDEQGSAAVALRNGQLAAVSSRR